MNKAKFARSTIRQALILPGLMFLGSAGYLLFACASVLLGNAEPMRSEAMQFCVLVVLFFGPYYLAVRGIKKFVLGQIASDVRGEV